jgi:hypothetical protein
MNEPPEASSAIEPPPPVGIETDKQEPIAPPAPSKEGASKPDAMKAIRIGDKGVPPRVFNTVPISQRECIYASRSPNLDGPPPCGPTPPAMRARAAGLMPNSSAARSIALAAADETQTSGLGVASPARDLTIRPPMTGSFSAIRAMASSAVLHLAKAWQ